ncbi:unnamed protein product, partial [Rotaria sp. Silwood1]
KERNFQKSAENLPRPEKQLDVSFIAEDFTGNSLAVVVVVVVVNDGGNTSLDEDC